MVKNKATADDFSFQSFLSGVQTQVQQTFSDDYSGKNIIEFLDTEVDKSKEGWGIDLNYRQKLVLKTFYGLELSEEDVALLEAWKSLDRSTYDLTEPPVRRQALVLESGRRSGKTLIASVILAYEWYKLCMRPNPQAHYGIAASTLISIICLATSGDQVGKTIYGQARALLYYVPKIKKLIDEKKIVVGEEMIKYQEKLLYIYSGNSKASSQVGGACILLVMDEAALFQDAAGESNAQELWDDLGISGLTFGNDALRIAISSADHIGDAIEVFYKDAKLVNTWIGYRLRSWDLNPVIAARDSPFIAGQYATRPIKAALHFEGVRTASQNIFFDKHNVLNCFKGTSVVKINRTEQQPDNLIRLEATSVEPSSVLTYLHLDPAIVGDNYGMAFGHSENIGGKLMVIIDGIAAWEPDGFNHVSVTNVQQIVYTIHQKRPLTKITADHKESAETLQRFKAVGIQTETLYASNKLQVETYAVTADLLNEGRLILPRDSPWTDLLKREMLTIEKYKEKIRHPSGGSKDIIDCVSSVVWQVAGRETSSTGVIVINTNTKANKAPLQINVNDSDFAESRREFLSNVRRKKYKYSDE